MKTSHHSDNQPTAENVQEAGRGSPLPRLVVVLRWHYVRLTASLLFLAAMIYLMGWAITDMRSYPNDFILGAVCMWAVCKISGFLDRKCSDHNVEAIHGGEESPNSN